MPEAPYAREVELVQKAIGLLKAENDTTLIRELEQEQLAAGTSLEWYGITKSMFERFLASRRLSDETSAALRDGVHAVRVIYGSEKASKGCLPWLMLAVRRRSSMRTFTRLSSIAGLLRIVAIFLMLDGGAFLLPERWINSFLASVALEPMPPSMYLSYLLQAAGCLQIASGVLIWVIATDVVRYRPLVITTIAAFLVGAPLFYVIDARVGLPRWWCVMDFASLFLCGAVPLGFCLWPARTPPKPLPAAATPPGR